MHITEDSIVGELVAADYRTAAIFKARGIDFCCKGNRSIADACERKHVDISALIEDLQQAMQCQESAATDYTSWPLDLLADYVEKKHHRYVETKIPQIKPFLEKVARVHGDMHPELLEIEQLFNKTAGELTMHMKKEELMLFPFIRKMVRAQENNEAAGTPMFGTVENPVAQMKHDHDEEGERFRKIAALSDNYTPPLDACNTYRVTLALLKEFEEDLHLHIHLENNILFPKAIALEKELNTSVH